MGYNTVALFLNDRADEVRNHADKLGEGLYRCMASARSSADRPEVYMPGQTTVLKSEHADTLQIVVAGGNSIRPLGYAHWTKFSDDEAILRALADHLGFTIRRKPARKGQPA